MTQYTKEQVTIFATESDIEYLEAVYYGRILAPLNNSCNRMKEYMEQDGWEFVGYDEWIS